MNVYDQLTKQIQQLDLKVSLLLTWNGVIATLLSREVGRLVGVGLTSLRLILPAISLLCLVSAAYYIMQVLIPRKGIIKKSVTTFTGLLYSGDIMNLGKTNPERVSNYLSALNNINSHEQIYEQFTRSIVLISQIFEKKNRAFIRGLIVTSIGFGCLIGLMFFTKIKQSLSM